MSIKSITFGGRSDIKKVTIGGGVLFESGTPEPPVLLSWEHVLWSIENDSYTTDYTVGDLIPLDLGTDGAINMQIVAFNADDKADGTGKAHISFVSEKLLAAGHRMNLALTPSSAPYDEGTGTIGGWEKSEMRSYLKSTIKPLIRSDVRSAIVEVTKYTNIYNTAGTLIADSESVDDVWIPSMREIYGGLTYETKGVDYVAAFRSVATTLKTKVNASSATYWWLRSASSTTKFRYVLSNGTSGPYDVIYSFGVALGFCL